MPRLILSDTAKADIKSILAYSRQYFGVITRDAYYGLIRQALRDLREDPTRSGVRVMPEIGDCIYSYHLKNAWLRTKPNGISNEPSHWLLFRVERENTVGVGRVLGNGMDPSLNAPSFYGDEAE